TSMRSTVPWRVAGPLAAVLLLAGGLQAQTPGGGRCGQRGQSGFFPGGQGGPGRQNLLTIPAQQLNGLTNLNPLLNGSTNPTTLLSAVQRRQTALQNALQRTTNRLNNLLQNGSTNQTVLVSALQQRQNALQNALQQLAALQV